VKPSFGENRFSAALGWTRRLFIPLAVCFLAYSAYNSANLLGAILARLSMWDLAGAWICWCLAQVAGPLSTVALARILGLPFGYRELSRISMLRIPARYLPGGIWQSVARFAAYTQLDINKADSFVILVAEHAMALGTSAFLGALLLLGTAHTQALRIVAVAVLTAACALLMATGWWITKKHGGLRKLLIRFLWLTAAVLLFWILAATSFYLYWKAAFASPLSDVPRIASCYLLSWSVGFVVPFAPQGLGVFEWVAGSLLSLEQPIAIAVTVIAGFRLVAIAADFFVWIVTRVWVGIRGRYMSQVILRGDRSAP